MHQPATILVRPDRRLVRPAGGSRRHLVIDVTAPVVERDPSRRRPPVNLGFVLDRSGSMGGHDKLGLAKQAVLESIHRLDPEDRFAVVTYDDQVEVVLPGSFAGPEARREAKRRLDPVEARGTTDLHAGWLTGCEQVAAGLLEQGVNRVLLLTDGLANRGVTDPAALAGMALDLRSRGVSTSTLGVGTDFDEDLLQAMADSGGGHFYFAGDVTAMRDHITSEVGETLDVVAREVVVDLRLPAGVTVEPVSPFRVEQGPGWARVHLGDMVSGQLITIALRLTFGVGEIGVELDGVVRLVDRDGVLEVGRAGAGPVRVHWAVADDAANDAQPRDMDVARVVARLDAEQARRDALRHNKAGRFDDARQALARAQQAIEAVAEGDPELEAMAHELTDAAPAMAAPMPELARKEAHFLSVSASRSRTPDGRSRTR